MENLLTPEKNQEAADRNKAIASVAQSEERARFSEATKQYYQAFKTYLYSLSEEERQNTLENLNNDDFIPEFRRKAGLEELAEEVNATCNDLLALMESSGLNEDDISSVFFYDNTDAIIRLKTRSESDKQESCMEKKMKADNIAKDNYDSAIAGCDKFYGDDPFQERICLDNASAAYKEAEQRNYNAYKECIEEERKQ